MKKLLQIALCAAFVMSGCDFEPTGWDFQLDLGCPYGDMAYCDDWPDNGVWDPPDTTSHNDPNDTTAGTQGYPSLGDVMWAESLFVVVGQKILTSKDGRSFLVNEWNQENQTWPTVERVIHKANRYIAYLNNGRVLTSDSVPVWHRDRINGPLDDMRIFNVASSGSLCLGLVYSPTAGYGLCRSSDGISWTGCQAPRSVWMQDVIFDGKYFVISAESLSTSVDAQGNKQYVTVGVVLTTPDGEHYRSTPTGRMYGLSRLSWANGFYAGVGRTDSASAVYDLVVSEDRLTWSQLAIAGREARAIATDGIHIVVALGLDQGLVHIDRQGLVTPVTVAGLKQVNALVYAHGQFIAAGNGAVATSPDGLNWTLVWQSGGA